MNSIKTTFASIALGAAALLASGAAHATTAPGEQVGLDEASPLPEGIFFINTTRFERLTVPGAQAVENIPIIAWSTPWHILGGRLEILAAAPSIAVSVPGFGDTLDGFVAPVAGGALAWDLGGGASFSNIVLEYAPTNNPVSVILGINVWTFRDTAAFTYKFGGGWTFMADGTINLPTNDVETGAKVQDDTFLYDISLLKSFGKWTVGAVAFGTHDIEHSIGTCTLCGYRDAAGVLVGYDFGPVTLQAFATQDYNIDGVVNAREASTFWTRAIIPLWVAPAESMK